MKPQYFYSALAVVLLIAAMVILPPYFSGCGKQTDTTTNTTNNNTVNKPNVPDKKTGVEDPIFRNEPYNAGLPVPNTICIDIQEPGNYDNPGGTGATYEDATKKTIVVWVTDEGVDKVRRTSEGGNVRDAKAPPQVKGGWDGNIWSLEDMTSEQINGKKYWVKRGIELNKIVYDKLGYCIFLGYSIQGGPREDPTRGWDKWYHDQHARGGLGHVAGAYDNGAGGENGWIRMPKQ